MRDLVHNLKVVSALTPATLSSFAGGLAIDRAGYESLVFAINVGSFSTFDGTNKLTVVVQSSETTTDGDFVAIAADDYLGTYKNGVDAWDRIMDGATDDESCFTIGVRIGAEGKRYYRIHITEGATVSVIINAVAILGHPRHAPINQPQP